MSVSGLVAGANVTKQLFTLVLHMQLAYSGRFMCEAQVSLFDNSIYSSMDMQALHAALASCTCCSSTLRLSSAAARSARSAKSLQRMQLVLVLHKIRPFSKMQGDVLAQEYCRM